MIRARLVAVIAAVVPLGAAALSVWAQDGAPSPRLPGLNLGAGLAGQTVFANRCASCHTEVAPAGAAEGRAPTLATLQQLPPERVLSALVDGKMKAIGDQMPDKERRAVAEWLGGRPLGAADVGDASKMAGRCAARSLQPAGAGDWNGWGADLRNSRHQPRPGFTAADASKLKLKWAFVLPGGAEAYSQPTVVGGRVYVGGDNGFVYALDAKSGCVFWSFRVGTGVRTAPTVAVLPSRKGAGRTAVMFGDMKGYAYAVDARTGAAIWKTRVDDQPLTKVSGAPTYYAGRLYVATTTGEEVTAAATAYQCCRTRGTVSALDASTGRRLWKTYMTATPRPTGKNSAGVTTWGPAGVGVWAAPTVDTARKLLYIATGDAYTVPAAPLSDSIVALDLATGKVRWSLQDTPEDSWLAGCVTGKPAGNCPAKVGPDWDFGASAILEPGRGRVVGAHKGGVVLALDPARKGALLWRRNLATKPPGPGGEIVFGGAADRDQVYFGLSSGSLVALAADSGAERWRTPIQSDRNRGGVSAAVTSAPGMVLVGSWDGVLRIYDARDGRLLWSFDTAQGFKGVNGLEGKGGSFGAPGPVVAEGMVFVASGYVGVANGAPGDVVLAFAPD